MAYGSVKVDSIVTTTKTVTVDDLPSTGTNQTFTKAQRGAVVALTSASTVTADFAAGNNFSITLGHAVTFANPSNLVAGQSGCIVITQSSGTLRSLSWGNKWKFVGGSAPDATQSASAVDILSYFVESSSRISATLLSDVK